jgi:energy-converting hydrogenase Eha subunit A
MGLIEVMAWIGRIFIGITLGAVFAGLFSAALTAFIERIDSLIIFIGSFF